MPNGLFTLKQQILAIQEGAWPNQKTPAVDYLVVAGGGGSACSGGGAGGLLTGAVGVVSGSAITVTVGGGGPGASDTAATQGANSVFGGITATGGGFGVALNANGGSGGSGGGGGASNGSVRAGGSGTSGQGNAGGNSLVGSAPNFPSGGGGGAGTVGLNAPLTGLNGNGGAGIASSISGTVTTYAGGGGGMGYYASPVGSTIAGTGGAGGGGTAVLGANGNAGSANTGGGGGGAGTPNTGGAGGSGVVIISYPDVYAAPTATTGSPTVSTSGSGSIVFDGSGDYVRYPTSTNYAFGTGDFTVEAFIYRSNTDGMILDARSGALSEPWCFLLSGVNLMWINGSGNPTTSTTVPSGSWVHVAACRSGSTFKLFINGVAGFTGTDAVNYTTTSPLLVGLNTNLSNNPFSGNISNVRITKGTAVYTADFTPPTAPLTKLTNTGFLLNTVSGAVFADSAANAVTNGTGGQVAWSELSPFATGLGFKNRVYRWTSSGSITF